MTVIANALVLVGFLLWVGGMLQSSRLGRRFRQIHGRDLYPLREIAERYTRKPWRWPLEAPGVTARMLRVGTTPHAEPELERMRLLARRLYGTGLALFLLGGVLALFR